MNSDVAFIPYACIAYIAVAWIGGLVAYFRYKTLLDGEVRRFANHRNLSMGEGHHLSGSLGGVPVELAPGRVSVKSGTRTAWAPATKVVVDCDPAHRYVVLARGERFTEPMPELDTTVGSSDPDFDAAFLLQTSGADQVPFSDEALVLRSVKKHKLLWAEAKDGVLRATFRSDRLNDERLGSFAHLEQVLHTALCMAEPRGARQVEAELTGPIPGAPAFPRLIYGFSLGLLGGFVAMVTAGEMIGETMAAAGAEVVGWPELGLVKAWHFFVAGFAAAHLVGIVLIVIGQAIWRATRGSTTVASSASPTGGPYR